VAAGGGDGFRQPVAAAISNNASVTGASVAAARDDHPWGLLRCLFMTSLLPNANYRTGRLRPRAARSCQRSTRIVITVATTIWAASAANGIHRAGS
jgi:hypothetical protein